MFGYIKRKLQDMDFKSKEDATEIITKAMFTLDSKLIESFYRKTLNNMLRFWFNLNRSKINEMIE